MAKFDRRDNILKPVLKKINQREWVTKYILIVNT